MTKIVVMSDNHGKLNVMDKILAAEKPDIAIHCGDHLLQPSVMSKRFDYFVLGNNDTVSGKIDVNVVLDNFRFRVVHGHTLGFSVYNPVRLLKKISDAPYDVLLFGHLHTPVYLHAGGKHVFNPGSVSFPRSEEGPTYGVITIKDKKITFTHRKVATS